MFPDLFGINDFSYVLMILLGVIAAFAMLILYLKKANLKTTAILDVLICACFSILIGIIGAILTQNLYEVVRDPQNYKWSWGMTFYGGLLFGAAAFIVLFKIAEKKEEGLTFRTILVIAPACITLAHAFGRIGCLLAGCCYGIETNSWIGLDCSSVDHLKRVPTQLFESIFLFILSGGLAYLAFAKHFKYTFPVYLFLYGIFRFVIEFFRDDDRGGLAVGLSPSQYWCIALVVLSIPLVYLLRFVIYKEKGFSYEQKENN